MVKNIVFLFLLLGLIIFSFNSCTIYQIKIDPKTSEWQLKETGAPLLNRNSSWHVTHSWLDEKNILHEIKIYRSTEENASQQVELIKLIEALTVGNKVGAGAK